MGIKFSSINAFVNYLGSGGLEKAVETGALRIESQRCAHEVVEEIHRVIGTYEYGWTPLSPETIARKAGGDTPLLETGKLKASYTARIFKIRNGYRIRVSSSLPEIAFSHEFGTARIPPRPIMQPAVRIVGQHCAARLGPLAAVSLSGRATSE